MRFGAGDQNKPKWARIGARLELAGAISLGVAIVFTALAFGAVEAWSQAVFSLMAFGLAALVCVKGVMERSFRVNIPPVAWPLTGLLLFGLAQSVAIADQDGKRFAISMDVEATRLSAEILLALLLSALAAGSFLRGERRLAGFVNFLIVFGLALAVFGIAQRLGWNGKYYWVIEPSVPPSSPFGPFVSHNHFAGYMELILPIPLALALSGAAKGERALLYGFAATIMAVAVIVSLSRGGMISLTGALVFVLAGAVRQGASRVKGRRGEGVKRRRGEGVKGRSLSLSPAWSKVAAAAVIVVTIGVGVWWVGADPVIRRVERSDVTMNERSNDPHKESFFQSRGWIWRDTIAMIRDNWALGVGLGAFQTAYPIYSRSDGSALVSEAHNDYLQIVADCGAVGAGLALWFIWLLAAEVRRALSHRDEMMAGTALGCAAGCFALLIHSLFDFNLQLPSTALLFLALTVMISQIAKSAGEGRVSQAFLERAMRLKAPA
jgi:O-antigen ligase